MDVAIFEGDLAGASADVICLRQLAKNEPIDVPAIRSGSGAPSWRPAGSRAGRGGRPKSSAARSWSGAIWSSPLRELTPMLDAVPGLPRGRPLMKHSLFRGLDAARSMRFLTVHDAHHLRIVRGILASRRTASTST